MKPRLRASASSCPRSATSSAHLGKDPSIWARHVEVLSDFVDAYDVLLEQEAPAAPLGLAPGVLTKEGLQRLRPGEPLRGVPPQVSVGSPLCNLPDCWQDAEGSEV